MAHVHDPVLRSNAELAEKARNVHPVQFTRLAVLTIIASVFTAIGWTAGFLWFVVVFSALWTASRLSFLGQCVRYGFHKGAKRKIVPARKG